MPQGPMSSPLMRPLVVLALPGMYLFYKYNQYKRRQQETARRRLTERELQHLNHKINASLVVLMGEPAELGESTRLQFERVAPEVSRLAMACLAHCPQALMAVCARPVMATLPLVTEIFFRNGCCRPEKHIGCCALQQCRANAILSGYSGRAPETVHVPLIGGPEPCALVPVLSQANPHVDEHRAKEVYEDIINGHQEVLDNFTDRDSTTAVTPLSEAYAISTVAKKLAAVTCGAMGTYLTGFVRTDVHNLCRYFMTELMIGPMGIIYTNRVPQLTPPEQQMLEMAIQEINEHQMYACQFLEPKTIHSEVYRIAT